MQPVVDTTGAPGCFIMNANNPAIFRQPKISLHGIGALIPCQAEVYRFLPTAHPLRRTSTVLSVV